MSNKLRKIIKRALEYEKPDDGYISGVNFKDVDHNFTSEYESSIIEKELRDDYEEVCGIVLKMDELNKRKELLEFKKSMWKISENQLRDMLHDAMFDDNTNDDKIYKPYEEYYSGDFQKIKPESKKERLTSGLLKLLPLMLKVLAEESKQIEDKNAETENEELDNGDK